MTSDAIPPRPSGRFEAPVAAVAAILAVAAFAGPALRPGPDADTWWHLRAGAELLAGGRGAFQETWSFTAAGRPWINHEWLAQGLLALARQAAGGAGVVLLTAVLLALTALLLMRAARLQGLPPAAACAGLALAAAVAGDRFVPRPQVFGYLCLALLLERLAAARRGRGSLWVLPLIQAVWTNVHGPLEGLAIGGLLLAGGSFPGLTLRRRLLLLAAILGASLVHPQGYHAMLDSLSYFGREQLFRQVIQEWLPLLSAGRSGMPQLPATWVCVVLSALAGLAGLLNREARRSPGNALLLLAMAAAPLLAVRHRDLTALCLTPGAAQVLSTLGAGGLRKGARPLPAIATAAALALSLFLVIVPGAGLFHYRPVWPPAPALAETGFPAAAAGFVETHRIGGRIFNSYDFGGYLNDRLAPEWKVFIDGRYVVYGEALVRDYLETRDGGPRAREILESTRTDLLLVRYPRQDGYQGLAARVRTWPDWGLVFWDDATLLYARRRAVPAAWLASHEYRRFDPTLPPAMNDPAWWRLHLEEILVETGRASREAPAATRPLLARALALEYSGRNAEAAEAYRAVLVRQPANRQARDGLARTSGSGAGPRAPVR